jgi:hypothetical protein
LGVNPVASFVYELEGVSRVAVHLSVSPIHVVSDNRKHIR